VYRVQFRISVEYLGLLPRSERVILRVPQLALLHDFQRAAERGRGDIFRGHLLLLLLPERKLVGPDVKQHPQPRDAEAVHGVLEHEAGAGDSGTAQLWAVQEAALALGLEIFRRRLRRLQERVSNPSELFLK